MIEIYTLIYAALHFLVDGICAMSMYGWLAKAAAEHWMFLVFFFCAYVLQLPFGILADYMIHREGQSEKEKFLARLSWLGILFTIAGACTTPVLMGAGSALFHIGSTAGCILEDQRHGRKGLLLGVYLAPGFVGEYLAKNFLQEDSLLYAQILFLAACGSILLLILIFEISMKIQKKRGRTDSSDGILIPVETVRLPEKKKWDIPIAVCCFVVVVFHFGLGETMEFTWRSGIALGFFGVIAVMAGKIAGGILNARYGACTTMFISMLAASVLFCPGNFAPAGLLAFAAYNMLVPVTLYIMEEQFPTLPGFSAGLLACALFPGYLPMWMKLDYTIAGVSISHSLLGSLSSMIFLALLLVAGWLADRE